MRVLLLGLIGSLGIPVGLQAQTNPGTPPPSSFTLQECISYALENQAEIQQAQIDEEIGERQIRAQLSGWLPQISAQYALTHNIRRPQSVFGDNVVTLGQNYNSNLLFQANQNLYSNDLVLASRAARFTRLQLDQNTKETKINTVVEVSKAFYNVLLTQEQLQILEANIARQEKQYQDARAQYEQGLVDKTDYQRASITLASIRADRKRAQENIKARTAFLKELMGLPIEADLQLTHSYEKMQQNIRLDTTQVVSFVNRVEFQQLRTQQQLQNLNTRFYRWGWLPTASAFINYNPVYFNNNLSDLYSQSYPTSATGLQVSMPIFQGTRRIQNLRISQLQEQRLTIAEQTCSAELIRNTKPP
ncbi:TolC family protein [Rufibacter roseus]|uniref:TolC family protein n=1 Tax=Rufibacter roseus TaxID=1567108 RepID=UPI0021D07504|nr:TolC family protein [Rufibacter roseus]